MKQLLSKLATVKSELKPIVKDTKNSFFNSNYFDINSLLEQVEPVMTKHGLLLLQPIIDGNVVTRIYDVETGEHLESSLKITEVDNPQKMGSGVTYFRRYTLQSLLALQAEDDDGNAASHGNKPVLKQGTEAWEKAIVYMVEKGDIEAIKRKYIVSPSDEAILRK